MKLSTSSLYGNVVCASTRPSEQSAQQAKRHLTAVVRAWLLLWLLSMDTVSAQDSQSPPGLRVFYTGHSFHMFVPEPKRIRENAQRDDARIEDLQAAVDDWRKKLEAQADDLNRKHDRKAVFIVPVGDAVVKLRAMIVDGKFPGVSKQSELFTDPIGHGKEHVQVLASYCNFTAIYRIAPSA